MPTESLASKVRAKFPGAYDDLSDHELEVRVLAVHPEYADLASPEARIQVATGRSVAQATEGAKARRPWQALSPEEAQARMESVLRPEGGGAPQPQPYMGPQTENLPQAAAHLNAVAALTLGLPALVRNPMALVRGAAGMLAGQEAGEWAGGRAERGVAGIHAPKGTRDVLGTAGSLVGGGLAAAGRKAVLEGLVRLAPHSRIGLLSRAILGGLEERAAGAAAGAGAAAAGAETQLARQLAKQGTFASAEEAAAWLKTLNPQQLAAVSEQMGMAPAAAAAGTAAGGAPTVRPIRPIPPPAAAPAAAEVAAAAGGAEPTIGSSPWRVRAFARPEGPTDVEWAKMGGSKARRAWLEATGRVPGAMGPSDVLALQSRGVPPAEIEAMILRSQMAAKLNPAAAAKQAAAAARADAARRVGLDIPSTVVPEAVASQIASRLRQLYQTSGSNKQKILEEGARTFGKSWPEVKKLILAPNVKIPLMLLGLGGAWGASRGDDLGGPAA